MRLGCLARRVCPGARVDGADTQRSPTPCGNYRNQPDNPRSLREPATCLGQGSNSILDDGFQSNHYHHQIAGEQHTISPIITASDSLISRSLSWIERIARVGRASRRGEERRLAYLIPKCHLILSFGAIFLFSVTELY